MKLDWSHLEPYRKTGTLMGGSPGDLHGVFYFRRGSAQLVVIASTDGAGPAAWEHVSARVINVNGSERVPSWAEMSWLKNQFWEDEECVVQFHPPKSEYVNCHPFVLHLWKPLGFEWGRPDWNFVGPVA